MFKLTLRELDDAFKAIEHHGYSTLIPPPPEWKLIAKQWPAFRAALAKIDLDMYVPYSAMRLYAPKSRINLRPVTILHPQDLIFYTALTLIVKRDLERGRVAVSKNRVFSFRSKLRPRYQLYQSEGAYEKYRERLRRKAAKTSFVAVTDIGDFYPRLNQHRLSNVIRTEASTDRAREVPRVLVEKFIDKIAGRNSYGIPIGPHASRVLGEAVLIDVDSALLGERMDFVRWVDDYNIFCATEAQAQRCLFFLGEWLYEQHGLTLQPSKTRIDPSDRFLKLLDRDHETRLRGKSEAVADILRFISGPYDDEQPDEDYVASVIEGQAVVGLLAEAFETRRKVDYELADFVLRRVASAVEIDKSSSVQMAEILVNNAEDLYPIADSVARFLIGMGGLSASERSVIAKPLLRMISKAKIRPPDFYSMWILHVFAAQPAWGQADIIRSIYTASRSDIVRRYAALALESVGGRAHALAVKGDIVGASPLVRTAIMFCSRKLGADERRHWRSANTTLLTGLLEQSI